MGENGFCGYWQSWGIGGSVEHTTPDAAALNDDKRPAATAAPPRRQVNRRHGERSFEGVKGEAHTCL